MTTQIHDIYSHLSHGLGALTQVRRRGLLRAYDDATIVASVERSAIDPRSLTADQLAELVRRDPRAQSCLPVSDEQAKAVAALSGEHPGALAHPRNPDYNRPLWVTWESGARRCLPDGSTDRPSPVGEEVDQWHAMTRRLIAEAEHEAPVADDDWIVLADGEEAIEVRPGVMRRVDLRGRVPQQVASTADGMPISHTVAHPVGPVGTIVVHRTWWRLSEPPPTRPVYAALSLAPPEHGAEGSQPATQLVR